MTFISSSINIGDTVRLTRDVEVLKGTFTKGHVFKVISQSYRGYDLIDENNEMLGEVGFLYPCLEKVHD